MDRKRRAAWESAIAKRERGEDVPEDEHYALLREGMFDGEATPDVQGEADLFLRYWCGEMDTRPLPWLGQVLADHWFRLRDEWGARWGPRRADAILQEYINAAGDFDHWQALSLIAARLHRAREPFPDVLADWAASVHEGREAPKREQAHMGNPPYALEERNRFFAMADHYLERFGMTHAKDRLAVIAGFFDTDDIGEDVVRKGLKRHRDDTWRRAPWPKGRAAIPK